MKAPFVFRFPGFIFQCLILILIFWILSRSIYAQERLFIGFTKSQAISSLSFTKGWHDKEMGKIVWPLIYDQLWMMGPAPSYKPLPGLASQWETGDYKTWRFHIHNQAKFSDQINVSIKDVLFSLNLFTKNSNNWTSRDVLIESFEILDNNVLQVTLRHPHCSPYPPFYRIPILPRRIWEKYQNNLSTNRNKKAIGSGPYILKEFKPGEVLRLVKNEFHHSEPAKFDELVFLIFPDKKALSTALKSGTVDLFGYGGIDVSRIREFDSAKGVKTLITDGMELFWLSFNFSKNPAIRDSRVRKAIMSAIDKSQITQEVFGGYAKEIDSFIYPELAGYRSKNNRIEYDIQQAHTLLNAAGYKDLDGDRMRDNPRSNQSLSFSLLVSNVNRSQVKIAELIRAQIAKLGIRMTLMQVNSNVYNDFIHNPTKSHHDIALSSGAPGPYQDSIWSLMKSDEGFHNQANQSNYVNHAFDRIFERLLTTDNPNKRLKYLGLAQGILAEDLPYGLLVRPYKICPVRQDRINDVVISMGGVSSEINLWNYISSGNRK